METIKEAYNALLNDAAHPRLQEFYIVRSSKPIVIILALYLLFVLKIGPALMQKRKAYELRKLLMIYNAFQVVSNVYIFYSVAWTVVHLNWFCEPVGEEETVINVLLGHGALYYFYIKIIDLCDTVFFVLRKKTKQVTFLHVYHHTLMVLFSWLGTNYVPGGSSFVIGIVNLLVHVVMYTYYFLTSMGMNLDRWKKYVTQLQLIQHSSIFILFSHNLFLSSCGFPKIFAFLAWFNAGLFIYLFGQFYLNHYVKDRKERRVKTT